MAAKRRKKKRSKREMLEGWVRGLMNVALLLCNKGALCRAHSVWWLDALGVCGALPCSAGTGLLGWRLLRRFSHHKPLPTTANDCQPLGGMRRAGIEEE